MKNIHLNLFFDESGKTSPPTIMGGLSIPTSIYEKDPFIALSQQLRDETLKLHWNEYSGYEPLKKDVINVINLTMPFSYMFKFNVINYHRPNKTNYSGDLFQEMIYTKLPERILYGLLRGYGHDVKINANVLIENATEYEKVKLNTLIRNQLNVQSLYRGEQFKVSECRLCPKGQEWSIYHPISRSNFLLLNKSFY